MKPRQRRAARRRALRKRFPIGRRIWADTGPDAHFGEAFIKTLDRLNVRIGWPSMFGEWFVYGYKGQALRVRRAGMTSGYVAYPKELAQ